MSSPEQQLSRSESTATESQTLVPSNPVTARPEPMAVGSARRELQYRLDLSNYLEIPFMHKRLIVMSLIGSALLGWLALLFWPRKFESESKLAVQVGRESVSLDPTATTSQTLMLQKTQEEEINSALEVLGSRQVAETVVKKIGAGPILEGVVPSTSNEAPSWLQSTLSKTKNVVKDGLFYCLLTAGIKDDISDFELAVRRVQSSMYIYAPKKSSVITIHAESKTPEMAQRLGQELTSSFLDEHLQVTRTDGSQDFFLQQSNEIEGKLKKLVTARSDFMQERKIVSIDANRGMLKDELAAIDRDLLTARGDLEQALAEIEDIESKLVDTEDEIVASKLEATDSTWSGMRQRVYELELLEKRYESMYTDDHQMLIQTREQLEGARSILKKLQSDRVDSSTTPNPVKRRMEEDLQKLQTRVVGLRSIIKEKERQRERTDAQVSELLQFEQQLSHMDRDISLMETSLNVLREKLEEARVINELQQKRISNISVFQPATFVERAVSPNKKLLVAGFILLGAMFGFGLAFVRQAASKTIRTATDVESQLGTCVVAEIPFIKRLAPNAASQNDSLKEQAHQVISEVILSGQGQSRFRGHSIGVLGIAEGCGATTLAANLAMAGAASGLKTILVDADSGQKSLTKYFGLNGAPGLVELVSGGASHEECLQHNSQTNIDVIACSQPESVERMIAKPDEIHAALSAYQHSCDLLIVDLPPANRPDQIISLTQQLDSVLLVVESEKSDSIAAERLVRRLASTNCNVVGCAINKTRTYLPSWLGRSVAPRS